jgi:hypothetical protein
MTYILWILIGKYIVSTFVKVSQGAMINEKLWSVLKIYYNHLDK